MLLIDYRFKTEHDVHAHEYSIMNGLQELDFF